MRPAPTILSLTIALLVLSVIFFLIERLRPALPAQRRASRDTITDLIYWFFTPLVTRAVTRIALGVVLVAVAWWEGITLADLQRLATSRQTWAASLPLAVQVPLMLLVADVLAYWTHRVFHTGARCGRFTPCIIRRPPSTGCRRCGCIR